MKISSAVVGMESSHQNISVQQSSLRLGMRMKKSEWDAMQALPEQESKDGNVLGEKLKPYERHSEKDKNKKSKEETDKSAIVDLSKKGIDASKGVSLMAPEKEEEPVPDKTMSTLRALLQYLKSISNNPKAYEKLEEFIDSQESLAKGLSSRPINNTMVIGAVGGRGGQSEPTVMVDRRETFTAESEYTKFSAAGIAKTEDGRELSFNVDFEMSRSFMEYTRTDKLYSPEPIRNVCDPLVINVGADVAGVSDQKFSFDLDSDGKKDSISMLEKGSGFLALDKNEDGRINDGNELFGTKSGDGFSDLAAYDEDGNGWIDENDSVFDKLKIWYRHDDGTDRLINLKDADVGALYLGKASTEFSLKSEDRHDLNGVIRSSGIFLKESGGAGTMQHVDLAL